MVTANSTNISNKIFRTQRTVIITILSFFAVFLIILSISSHDHIKNHIQTNEAFKQHFDKVNEFFTSPVESLENDKQLPDEIKLEIDHSDDEDDDTKTLKQELDSLIEEKD